MAKIEKGSFSWSHYKLSLHKGRPLKTKKFIPLLKRLPMNDKEKVMHAMCASYCGNNPARRDLAEWILARGS